MSRMTSFPLGCVLLLCFLSGISDGWRLRRQSGVPKVQSRVVLLGASACKVNDKEYKVGEEWTTGHLRYQCNEFGYNIVGCALSSGKILKINEDFVNNNTAYRCYRVGNATRTYYQEFTCGVLGMPSCELKPITKETADQALGGFKPINTPPVVVGQLPPGWKILDEHGNPIQILSGSGIGAGGTQTIVSSSHLAAETGSVGSGSIIKGVPVSGASATGGSAANAAAGTGSGAATSGVLGTAGSQSSVGWSGKSKGGVGIGPGTFTIRSGPTGSSTSFVPAGSG